jgi:hypothetical protein
VTVLSRRSIAQAVVAGIIVAMGVVFAARLVGGTPS